MVQGSIQVLDHPGDRYLVAGVVHSHTTASDGEHSVAALLAFAQSKGLGVVCVTDHHAENWHYCPGVTLRRPSVLSFGVDNYLAAIAEAATGNPSVIVIPGIEVMPHYRWSGIPPFLQCHAMKNLVVYGVDAEAIKTLPTRLDGRGRDEREARFTAQAVIDHVRSHGGLLYWSHLEQDERFSKLTASIRWIPRPELIRESEGYTGFGCFPQGFAATCQPGGSWDERLQRTLAQGSCDGPWTFGEADYHSGDRDEPYRNICNPVTVFSVDQLTAEAVLGALGSGRMYAYQGHAFQESILHCFSISDRTSGVTAEAGGQLTTDAEPSLHVRVSGFRGDCRIRVIADGRLCRDEQTRDLSGPLPRPTGDGYACRVEIDSSQGERIVSNPIFVTPYPGHAA